MKINRIIIIVTGLLMIMLTSCQQEVAYISVKTVSLNRTSVELEVYEQIELNATIFPSNAANKEIKWTSSDSRVAVVSEGVVTALKVGTAVVSATSVDGGIKAECNVTVQEKIVNVQSVSLNKSSMILAEGESEILTAIVLPADATDKSVTWSSSNSAIASVKDGAVKALTAGTATITVSSTDGAKKAECQVTVNAKIVNVQSVSLNKSRLTLTEGESEILTATVYPSNATDKSIIWMSSDTSVALVYNGMISTLRSGAVTITAITTDGGKKAECQVTVKEKIINVESVSLNKTDLILTEGDSEALTVSVLPENASDKSVTWTSSNSAVASVHDGTVEALTAGTATITVSSIDGEKKAECQVTVKAKIINVQSVSLNKGNLALTEGESETLTAIVYPSNATDKSVTWMSSDTSVATVDGGTVKALKAGTVTVRVTTLDGGKIAECKVTVKYKEIIGGHEGVDEKEWWR